MATIDVHPTARDMLECLRQACIIGEGLFDQLIAAHGARELMLAVEVDDDDLVERARTSVLIDEARDRFDYPDGIPDGDLEWVGEAMAYARRGDLVLAEAMAVRAFGHDRDLRPIERALRP